MKISLATHVSEEGTAIFTVDFKDEDDQAVVPNSVTWKLTDGDGTVVNSKSAESETPASSVDIVLSGDDLEISAGFGGSAEKRYVTVYGTYNSSYGSNLPYTHQFDFPIDNFVAIT